MSSKSKLKVNRLIDVLDKKEAKEIFKKYLKDSNLISKGKIVNDISMAMFEHVWNKAKSKKKKLNKRELLEILEKDLFRYG